MKKKNLQYNYVSYTKKNPVHRCIPQWTCAKLRQPTLAPLPTIIYPLSSSSLSSFKVGSSKFVGDLNVHFYSSTPSISFYLLINIFTYKLRNIINILKKFKYP